MVKRLEMEGKIERIAIDPKTVKNALDIAERDLQVAEKNLAINDEWAYNIAYNAILAAGRALMFSKGFRPRSTEGHIAVREFLEYFLPRDDVILFDRMRRKRHATTYDMSLTVSHTDAENAVRNAQELVGRIRALIQKEDFSS